MRFFKTPFFLPWIFSRREWGFSLEDASVFLTFDDGPNPDITPFVLDTLAEKGLKATFFCVGDNVRKHPDLYQRILNEGHRVGNHTMYHNKASKTGFDVYLNSFLEAESLIHSNLFRPPYGRLGYRKMRSIRKSKKIIMWSWLSYDYDKSVPIKKILQKAEKQIKAGDILVLHDNEKVTARMKELLPKLIEIIKAKQLDFKTIE
jgi:peptidoglycan/xylan/chitin deacetylase (PgdA/CDA1 family)